MANGRGDECREKCDGRFSRRSRKAKRKSVPATPEDSRGGRTPRARRARTKHGTRPTAPGVVALRDPRTGRGDHQRVQRDRESSRSACPARSARPPLAKCPHPMERRRDVRPHRAVAARARAHARDARERARVRRPRASSPAGVTLRPGTSVNARAKTFRRSVTFPKARRRRGRRMVNPYRRSYFPLDRSKSTRNEEEQSVFPRSGTPTSIAGSAASSVCASTATGTRAASPSSRKTSTLCAGCGW